MYKKNNQEGIALLITLLLMGIFLGIGTSLASITLRQYQISNIALDSEVAFHAANAGVECMMYYDKPFANPPLRFNIDAAPIDPVIISCMGSGNISDFNGGNASCNGCIISNKVESGEEQRFKFTWKNSVTGLKELCTDVSIYKFNSQPMIVEGVNVRPGMPCPSNDNCTVIRSRGYNVRCDEVSTGARVVEREITRVW